MNSRPFGRWDVLPVDAFAQVGDVGAGVGHSPACGQLALHVLRGAPVRLEIEDGRVQRPVVGDQPFQPGGMDVAARRIKGVEIHDIVIGADDQFPAVFRLPRVPPTNLRFALPCSLPGSS